MKRAAQNIKCSVFKKKYSCSQAGCHEQGDFTLLDSKRTLICPKWLKWTDILLFILRTPFILHRSAVDSLVASQMHYCTSNLTNAAKMSFFKKHMLLSPRSPVCLLAAYRGWPSSARAVSSSSEPMRRSEALCDSSTTCDCPESWPDGENRNSRKIVSGNGRSSILLSPLKWGGEETLTGMTALLRVQHSYLLIRHSKHHRILLKWSNTVSSRTTQSL